MLRLPEFSMGEFQVSARSHLFHSIVRHGSFEPDIAAKFATFLKPGADVIDVGANIGFFTISAARTGARVLSIEPTDGAYRRLKANIDRNQVSNRVILFKGLASDHEHDATFFSVEGLEEYSSMAPIDPHYISGHEERVNVTPARTIDSLVKQHQLAPTLMKVDVEGAEKQVFEGASKTIETYRPVVISELSKSLLQRFSTQSEEIIEFFRSHGYRVVAIDGGELQFGGDGYGNILCLPQ